MKKKTNRKVTKKVTKKKVAKKVSPKLPLPAPSLRRVQIGYVGVDSGQLLLCDPCYIASEWKSESSAPLSLASVYKDVDTGRLWGCALHNPPLGVSQFGTFDHPLPLLYDGRTPNELIASGRWVKQDDPKPGSGEFSYRGCCNATLSKSSAGQLLYKLGHAGAGVAFSSGYGDGTYPVFAYYNDEDRIVKVEVLMG